MLNLGNWKPQALLHFRANIFHIIHTRMQSNKQINIQLRVNSRNGILQNWKETNYVYFLGFFMADSAYKRDRTFYIYFNFIFLFFFMDSTLETGQWSGVCIISALVNYCCVIRKQCESFRWTSHLLLMCSGATGCYNLVGTHKLLQPIEGAR